jgi:hypothetical protein
MLLFFQRRCWTLGSELRRFATLSDQRYNEIEVIVEKRNGQVCFTHGWGNLNEIYGLKHSAVVTLKSMQFCYSDKTSLWWRDNLPIFGHSVLHKIELLHVSGTNVKGVCVSNSFYALLTWGRLLPIQHCKVFV